MSVLVAVLVVAVLVLVAVSVTHDDGTPTASFPGPGSTPTTEPADEPTTTTTAPPPTEEELDAVVDDIKAFVEQERGLEFVEPVPVHLADDTEFVDRLGGATGDQGDRLASVEVLYKAFGLIDPDRSFAEEVGDMMGAGVAGFYDPDAKELFVRATAITPFTRVVLAHELTHALDDQHFGLSRSEYQEAKDEISFGFSALVEGNAVWVQRRYFEQELSDEEQDQSIHEEMTAGASSAGSVPDVSFALVELFGAPYQYGPELITAVRDAGGQERLDEAFSDPPSTSEQVLDPDRFLASETRIDVAHPSPDGELVYESVLGQLFEQLTLAENVSNRVADDAGEGWGGDWAVAWRDGERSCTRLVVVGDSPADSDELRDAWTQWGDDHAGTATVEQATADEPVTVTACSE